MRGRDRDLGPVSLGGDRRVGAEAPVEEMPCLGSSSFRAIKYSSELALTKGDLNALWKFLQSFRQLESSKAMQ